MLEEYTFRGCPTSFLAVLLSSNRVLTKVTLYNLQFLGWFGLSFLCFCLTRHDQFISYSRPALLGCREFGRQCNRLRANNVMISFVKRPAVCDL